MKANRNLLLFRIIYFIVYFADGLFTPFYGLYLLSLGFSDEKVGILLGLIPFASCLGALAFGRLGKTFKKSLLLLEIIALWEGVGVLLLGLITNFYALIAIVILLAFVNGVYYQIEDGASSYALREAKASFNGLRIFGSIGFGIAMGVCYFLLKVWPYRYLFALAAALFGAVFILFLFIKPYDEGIIPQKQKIKGDLHGIFNNRSFLFFLLFYVLLDGSVSVQGYILPIFLKSLGLSDPDYSLLNGFRVFIEILTLVVYGPIKKTMKSEKNCLLLGGGLFLASFVSILALQNPFAIGYTNFFLRGVGGALLVIAFVDYLSAILPRSGLVFAMAFAVALMDIFTGSFNFAASFIYQGISFLGFFGILSGVGLVGYVFLFFAKDETKIANSALPSA
jgi:PPP family 3-phenylpropionic acid transporter